MPCSIFMVRIKCNLSEWWSCWRCFSFTFHLGIFQDEQLLRHQANWEGLLWAMPSRAHPAILHRSFFKIPHLFSPFLLIYFDAGNAIKYNINFDAFWYVYIRLYELLVILICLRIMTRFDKLFCILIIYYFCFYSFLSCIWRFLFHGTFDPFLTSILVPLLVLNDKIALNTRKIQVPLNLRPPSDRLFFFSKGIFKLDWKITINCAQKIFHHQCFLLILERKCFMTNSGFSNG